MYQSLHFSLYFFIRVFHTNVKKSISTCFGRLCFHHQEKQLCLCLVLVILYGWLSTMHSRQSSTQNKKHQVSHKHTVVFPDDGNMVARYMKRLINILRINCAPSWLYLQDSVLIIAYSISTTEMSHLKNINFTYHKFCIHYNKHKSTQSIINVCDSPCEIFSTLLPPSVFCPRKYSILRPFTSATSSSSSSLSGTHSYSVSFHHTYSFFIRSFVHSVIHSFIHSFTFSFFLWTVAISPPAAGGTDTFEHSVIYLLTLRLPD